MISRATQVDNMVNQLVERMVEDIHKETFRAHYHRTPYGACVRGWNERLKAYFWPTPSSGWITACNEVERIIDQGRAAVERIARCQKSTLEQQAEAVQWANEVFAWGRVRQWNGVTWRNVYACIAAALSGNDASDAPMNSGWTKVAAFASAVAKKNNFARGDVVQIAIWDSRVAASIIRRLDGLMPAGTDPRRLFPYIGTVPARSGTRPGRLRLRWPNGYQSWRTEIAGSKLIECIQTVLNTPLAGRQRYPRMPLPDGGTGSWNTRGVEMVLFMDGY
jgi:hypothetical protein